MNLIKINCESNCDSVFFSYGGRFHIMAIESVKTIEDDNCVSWFNHAVFKKLDHIYIDQDETEYLKLYAYKNDLYDLEKLRVLSETEEFKNQRYSFFNYGYVLQLLGGDVSETGVCGLF